MRFTQENLIIPLCSVGTMASTEPAFESFHMEGYDHATMIFVVDSLFGASASVHINCASSDGGDTANAMVHYRWSQGTVAAASADVLGSIASASVITLTTANRSHMLVVELDASDLPVPSKTYEWVTASLGGSATGEIMGVAVLSKPRFADAVMNTAIS